MKCDLNIFYNYFKKYIGEKVGGEKSWGKLSHVCDLSYAQPSILCIADILGVRLYYWTNLRWTIKLSIPSVPEVVQLCQHWGPYMIETWNKFEIFSLQKRKKEKELLGVYLFIGERDMLIVLKGSTPRLPKPNKFINS